MSALDLVYASIIEGDLKTGYLFVITKISNNYKHLAGLLSMYAKLMGYTWTQSQSQPLSPSPSLCMCLRPRARPTSSVVVHLKLCREMLEWAQPPITTHNTQRSDHKQPSAAAATTTTTTTWTFTNKGWGMDALRFASFSIKAARTAIFLVGLVQGSNRVTGICPSVGCSFSYASQNCQQLSIPSTYFSLLVFPFYPSTLYIHIFLSLVGIIMGLAQFIDKWIRKIFSQRVSYCIPCLMDHWNVKFAWEHIASCWGEHSFQCLMPIRLTLWLQKINSHKH